MKHVDSSNAQWNEVYSGQNEKKKSISCFWALIDQRTECE